MEQLVIDNVRAVLLDYLPNEIPYNLKVEMEYFDKKKGMFETVVNRIEGEKRQDVIHSFDISFAERIFACVNVVCPSKRIERLVSGSKNNRMQQIAETVTSELIRLYQYNVGIVINVMSHEKSKDEK